MDVIEAINQRCSIRGYENKPLSRDLLEKLVDAGRRAPTGRNVQPLEFIVITEKQTREQLASITEYGKFIAQAPACIAVYSKETKYFLEDGCAAIENILLAATGLGLGACWVAGDKKPYTDIINGILEVSDGFKLIALIPVGYPTKRSTPRPKRPLKEVLHWEKFNK